MNIKNKHSAWATGMVLALILAVVAFVAPGQSAPANGVQVPTLAEHNALEQRVTALESKVQNHGDRITALENAEPEPTPDPTPTPTPDPTTCVKPDATNTGATGTLTTYTGPTTITANGTVVENKRVSGGLVVQGDNVTIRNVEAPGGVFVQQGHNATIEKLTGSSVVNSSSNGLKVLKSNLGFVDDGDSLHITSDSGVYIDGVVIKNNWIHDPRPPAGAHYDGLQVRGAKNVTVECNTFDAGPYQSTHNAHVYFEYDNGGYSNVTVKDNWLIGNAWSTMWGTANDSLTKLVGNKFSNPHWGACYAQQSNSKPPTQSGNTMNGSAFTPCP